MTWKFADAPLLEVEHAKRLLAVARAELGTLAGRVILKGELVKPAHKSSAVAKVAMGARLVHNSARSYQSTLSIQ